MDKRDLRTLRAWRTTLERVISDTNDGNSAKELQGLLDAVDRVIARIQRDNSYAMMRATS
jgi:hypothetical protein